MTIEVQNFYYYDCREGAGISKHRIVEQVASKIMSESMVAAGSAKASSSKCSSYTDALSRLKLASSNMSRDDLEALELAMVMVEHEYAPAAIRDSSKSKVAGAAALCDSGGLRLAMMILIVGFSHES